MHPSKMQNLLKKSPNERYKYFIRHCADFEKVWGLVAGLDNWVIFKDKEGQEIFPLWPDSGLAEELSFKEHREMGVKSQAIELDSFMKNCIPDMIRQKVKFGIFYDQNREAMCVDGNRLLADLKEEIESVWE